MIDFVQTYDFFAFDTTKSRANIKHESLPDFNISFRRLNNTAMKT